MGSIVLASVHGIQCTGMHFTAWPLPLLRERGFPQGAVENECVYSVVFGSSCLEYIKTASVPLRHDLAPHPFLIVNKSTNCRQW